VPTEKTIGIGWFSAGATAGRRYKAEQYDADGQRLIPRDLRPKLLDEHMLMADPFCILRRGRLYVDSVQHLVEQDAVDAAPEPVPGLRRRVSGDGQVGHQDLSSCLRAQQHGDKEDGQAHHCGDENRTRKGNVLGGCV
jgi:hypothetical protein